VGLQNSVLVILTEIDNGQKVPGEAVGAADSGCLGVLGIWGSRRVVREQVVMAVGSPDGDHHPTCRRTAVCHLLPGHNNRLYYRGRSQDQIRSEMPLTGDGL